MANNTGIKFGGRKKGTPNKTTSELREYFNLLLNDNLEQLKIDIKELDPKERINVMLKISEFIIPKLKATDINLMNDNDASIKPIIIDFAE